MNTPKFKLEFQEKIEDYKHYIIVHDFESVGEIFFIIRYGTLHIFNVFIHDDYKGKVGFGNWLRTFETILVYNVLPESVDYWHRRKAGIVSTVEKQKFSDIIFEQGEEDA